MSAVTLIGGGLGTFLFFSNKPNYAQLESSLQAQDWQQADAETDKIVLQVARRNNALDAVSINEFPCEPLKKIDDLWMANSGERFGFTPQKKIYEDTGNEFNDYNQSTYEAFGDRIGWRIFGVWGLYNDIKFTDIAPRGHLPAPGRVGEEQKDLRIRERGNLLSRFDACHPKKNASLFVVVHDRSPSIEIAPICTDLFVLQLGFFGYFRVISWILPELSLSLMLEGVRPFATLLFD